MTESQFIKNFDQALVKMAALKGMGVRLSLEMHPTVHDLRWPDTVEHAVFMITREAVSNALQHAQAPM